LLLRALRYNAVRRENTQARRQAEPKKIFIWPNECRVGLIQTPAAYIPWLSKTFLQAELRLARLD
jgi:hypothetical protein